MVDSKKIFLVSILLLFLNPFYVFSQSDSSEKETNQSEQIDMGNLSVENEDSFFSDVDTYDFNEDVDEIKDYADSIDKGTMEGLADYQAAMQRYQAAATAVAPVEAKIVQYKSAIDQCEASIDTIQKNRI